MEPFARFVIETKDGLSACEIGGLYCRFESQSHLLAQDGIDFINAAFETQVKKEVKKAVEEFRGRAVKKLIGSDTRMDRDYYVELIENMPTGEEPKCSA